MLIEFYRSLCGNFLCDIVQSRMEFLFSTGEFPLSPGCTWWSKSYWPTSPLILRLCGGYLYKPMMWLMVKNPKPKSSSLELHWFLRIFWVVRYASSRCRCTYWKMPGIFPFCLFNSFCQVIKDMTCPLSYWSCYSPPPKNLECGPGCFTCFWKNQHKFGWSFPSKGALQSSARCSRASPMHVRWNSRNNDNVKSSWVASRYLGWAQIGNAHFW